VGVWVLSLLPSLVDVLPPELTVLFAERFADVGPYLAIFAAAALVSRSADSRERSFWMLWGLALSCWIGAQIVYAAVPADAWSTRWDLTVDGLYLGGYLLLAVALQRRPDRTPPAGYTSKLRQTEMLGTLVFAVGLLGYFIVIPRFFAPEVYASRVPSLVLWTVLDAFLIIRLLAILATQPRPSWIWPYRLLLVACGAWFLGDGLEALMYQGALPFVDGGTPIDVVWHVPSLLILLAVLSRGWREPPTSGDHGVAGVMLDKFQPGSHGFIAFALALPVLHLTLGVLGITEPGLQRPRVALALGMVLLFGGLLAWYQALLRTMASAMEADRALVSDQLQMAQRMEAVGRLADGVAHDFANVLSVIRGRAEMLLMSQDLTPQSREDVDELVEAARRGQALVTHLITISRRKSGDPHTLDLSVVAADVQELLEHVLPESLALELEDASERPLVMADRAQLEQVILNLILNARDAVDGRGTVRVRTDVVEVDDQFAAAHGGEAGGLYSLLAVSDTGPGVPPEMRELVFEPFFSTKQAHMGSGLGLSVVYGIVRQGSGMVRVTRSEEGGARFEVYLPLARGTSGREEPQAGVRPLPGRETVLLVEDNGAVRRTTARILREAGYRVLEAGSAADALAVLERRREKVDAMVADLGLPDLSGYELQIRALAAKPELAVVLMSGHPEGVAPFPAPQLSQVLRKPLAPDLLTLSVRRALAEARER
jgi:signal transduction histidine kinase/CheY-like chemotaxis protein